MAIQRLRRSFFLCLPVHHTNKTTLAIVAQKGRAIHDNFEPDAHDGLAFAGWNTSADGTGDWVDLWDYTPAGHVTLYAQWVTGVTVTFDANGRTFEQVEGQSTYVLILNGDQSVYSREWFIYNYDEGMMVVEWYDNPACDGDPVLPWGGEFMPTQDITLYAKWSEYWTVTFDGNGGHIYSAPGSLTVQEFVPKGYSLQYNPFMEDQNGLTFGGWYLNLEKVQHSP